MKLKHLLSTIFALLACGVIWAGEARATEAEAVRDDTIQQLGQGELKSMALTSDGMLIPSYGRRTLGDTRSEIVWDALREPNGAVLCATGHHGRLVRLVDGNTSKTLGTVSEPELTALARLKDGTVLVAAAPSGRIYKLDGGDKLTTYTQLNARFVWRMVPDEDGSVWAVTGTEGRLFHLRDVDGQARVEEVCKFKSANLLDLWIDRDGLLGGRGDVYVAGQNPGWLYRWRPATRKVEVVFNAQAEEIRRLLPTRDGLALALNTERSPSSQALSMTLRMTGSGGGLTPLGAPGDAAGGPSSSSSSSSSNSSLSQAFSPAQQANYGIPRSEVVLLDKSGFVRGLWQSPERPIHDLALSPDKKILAAVGSQGRLFEIAMNGDTTTVADIREDYLMRIVADEKGYLLAAGRNGVVIDMTRERAPESVYLSRALDAGKLVKWGQLYWRGELGGDQHAQVAFRIGNDGDTDSAFWSPWSEVVDVRPDQAVQLPGGPARFLQYRLTFRQGDPNLNPPRLDYVDVFFRGRNGAPRVLQVTASEASALGGGRSLSPPPSSSSLSTSGDKDGGGSAGGPPPAPATGQAPGGGRAPRSNPMSLNIAWRVIDPNGDALRYSVYFKAADERQWKLVDKDLSAIQLPLSVSGLADGRYRFRVVATDLAGNPPGEGLRDEGISNEAVVDNTPPQVENKAVRVEARRAIVTFEATDKTSLLASVRMDLDNGNALPLQPVDGVMDQPHESFRWQTRPLPPGEHVITFGVTDARGNTSVEKVVFAIQ